VSSGRILLFTWNLEKASAQILLSNLLSEVHRLKGAPPLLVDAVSGRILETRPQAKDSADPLSKFLRQVTVAQIPVCSFPELVLLEKELSHREKGVLLENRTVVILADEDFARALSLRVRNVVVLLHPEASVPSFLYKFLKDSKSQELDFIKLHLVLAGSPLIEAAAETFVTIRDELIKHVSVPFELSFTGFLSPDPERLKLARSLSKLLPEVFPGDGFHGQITAIWRNLLEKSDRAFPNHLADILHNLER
jgi:hypothetical protein